MQNIIILFFPRVSNQVKHHTYHSAGAQWQQSWTTTSLLGSLSNYTVSWKWHQRTLNYQMWFLGSPVVRLSPLQINWHLVTLLCRFTLAVCILSSLSDDNWTCMVSRNNTIKNRVNEVCALGGIMVSHHPGNSFSYLLLFVPFSKRGWWCVRPSFVSTRSKRFSRTDKSSPECKQE